MTTKTIATINESLNTLKKELEQGEIYYRATLSTYEITISQQIIQIRKLEEDIKEIKGERVSKNEPEPYPYTHPVREIPNYGKVKK